MRPSRLRYRRLILVLTLGLLGSSCGAISSSEGTGNDLPQGQSVSTTQQAPATVSAVDSLGEPSTTATTEQSEPGLAAVVPGSGTLLRDGFGALEGMTLGLIVNQTSVVNGTHLIDLVNDSSAVDLGAIFAPEHGVRGTADAGEVIDDEIDASTGAKIFSLYGETRQPTAAMLVGLDALVYDLQDVGARHYTYISTMGLAMQAAADVGIPFIVLDRPNPLGGDRIEGPVLEGGLLSFIGQYPIPSVYGLTAGELALMIKGEQWLGGLDELDLGVVEMENWQRDMLWPDTGLEWIAPSPGLPTFESALVYPGTVLIEATSISYGNGTLQPFTTVGALWLDGAVLAEELNELQLPGVTFEPIVYVPTVIPNMAPSPRFEGQELSGVRIEIMDPANYSPLSTGLELLGAIEAEASRQGLGSVIDRGQVFDLLTGFRQLRTDLASDRVLAELLSELEPALDQFRKLRQPYLLY